MSRRLLARRRPEDEPTQPPTQPARVAAHGSDSGAAATASAASPRHRRRHPRDRRDNGARGAPAASPYAQASRPPPPLHHFLAAGACFVEDASPAFSRSHHSFERTASSYAHMDGSVAAVSCGSTAASSHVK